MLTEIKIEFFEDIKYESKIGSINLALADFSQLEIIIEAIRKSQNDLGNSCHFKINAHSFDL
jgi:hypothetical protein